MAGGQQYKRGMELIVQELRNQGHHVMTGFVIGEDYEEGYPTTNAWERDIPLLQESDAVIAEISQRSDGVGIEIGISAVAFGKPVLCLRDKSLENIRLSQLITKGPFKLDHYDPNDIADLAETLQNFTHETENSKEKNRDRERLI